MSKLVIKNRTIADEFITPDSRNLGRIELHFDIEAEYNPNSKIITATFKCLGRDGSHPTIDTASPDWNCLSAWFMPERFESNTYWCFHGDQNSHIGTYDDSGWNQAYNDMRDCFQTRISPGAAGDRMIFAAGIHCGSPNYPIRWEGCSYNGATTTKEINIAGWLNPDGTYNGPPLISVTNRYLYANEVSSRSFYNMRDWNGSGTPSLIPTSGHWGQGSPDLQLARVSSCSTDNDFIKFDDLKYHPGAILNNGVWLSHNRTLVGDARIRKNNSFDTQIWNYLLDTTTDDDMAFDYATGTWTKLELIGNTD